MLRCLVMCRLVCEYNVVVRGQGVRVLNALSIVSVVLTARALRDVGELILLSDEMYHTAVP